MNEGIRRATMPVVSAVNLWPPGRVLFLDQPSYSQTHRHASIKQSQKGLPKPARECIIDNDLEQLFMELYELRVHDSVYPPLPQFDHLP